MQQMVLAEVEIQATLEIYSCIGITSYHLIIEVGFCLYFIVPNWIHICYIFFCVASVEPNTVRLGPKVWTPIY